MSNALTTLSGKLAERFGMGADGDLVAVLKATAFKGPATDAQLTALMVVAQQYGLNPFTKEIFAFPDKNNGIVPVVGVDGWSRIINSHDQFDGMEFEQDADKCTCVIYRKDRGHAIRVTEYMIECRRDGVGPWKSHPYRMLRHKALIQCARLAFGFVGIYDQDEAERIVEVQPGTKAGRDPVAAAAQNAPDDLAPFEAEHLEDLRDAAMNGIAALEVAFAAIPATKIRTAFWVRHGRTLKDAAGKAEVIDADTGEVTQ